MLHLKAMWIEYQPIADSLFTGYFGDLRAAWINNARLAGWMLGSVAAGWIADSLCKSCGDWTRISFAQIGNVLRIVFVVIAFGGVIPATLGADFMASGSHGHGMNSA